MPRRRIETIAALGAVAALAVVLYNATLVDRRPPTVARIYLSSTAAGDAGLAQTLTAIDLEFSEPVDRTSVEQRFRIDPYVSGTFSWDRDTVAIFTPARKLPSATPFTVSVVAGFQDLAGNAAVADGGPFAFRTVGPPVVDAVAPTNGAVGVSTSTTVALTFDRLMDTGAVEAAVSVQPTAGFRSSWSGPDLTLSFPAPLAFGTTYTITVGEAAADTDGSHLAAPFSASFTTIQAGLGVDALIPADGVSGIGVRTSIAVTFDGPIDPTSVGGALRITPPVDGDVRVVDRLTDAAPVIVPGSAASPGAASPSPTVPAGPAGTGSVLLFTPSGPLAPHTTYTIELAPVVRRADEPGQVAAGRTWTFTTGGPTTSAQNQIAFLSARGGVRNVWLMNPDGSNPRQITTELAPVSEYDVASDGRTLVYATGGVVKRMRIDASETVTLTAPGTFEYAPVLAPDGSAVLVGRRDAAGADLGWWLVPLPDAPAGRTQRQVLADGAPPLGSVELPGDGLVSGPGVSPWSRQAAFDPTGLSLMLVDGSSRVALVELAPADPAVGPQMQDIRDPVGAPAWDAALGSFVVVGESGTGSGPGLIAVGQPRSALAPAAGPVAVAGHGGIATLVAPDGTHVGYSAIPTTPPRALTSAADLLDRSPGFSPDATTLLFVRVPVATPDRSAGIWLAGLDGRDLRQISPDGADARWLP